MDGRLDELFPTGRTSALCAPSESLLVGLLLTGTVGTAAIPIRANKRTKVTRRTVWIRTLFLPLFVGVNGRIQGLRVCADGWDRIPAPASDDNGNRSTSVKKSPSSLSPGSGNSL